MNKLTKIGVSALCGYLAAISAAKARELSVSGGANMTLTKLGYGNTGNPLGMASSMTFTGSGELDNGMTVSVSFEMDQGTANNSSLGFDNHSVSVSSDTMGTLTLAGHGGSSATSAIDTTAAGDMWDNFDGLTVLGGVTIADAAIDNGGVDNSFFYASPDLMDGLNFTLSYNPQTATNQGETGYGLNYTGFEGLSISYAVTDEETYLANTTGDNTVIKASYAYGPVTVSYSEMDHDEGLSTGANDVEITSYALSYTISDELSVTYGSETSDKGSATTDLEIDGITAAYTTGGMTISLAAMEMENGIYGTAAAQDVDYWKLGASFAF